MAETVVDDWLAEKPAIAKMLREGVKQNVIAERYGVTPGRLCQVLQRNLRWSKDDIKAIKNSRWADPELVTRLVVEEGYTIPGLMREFSATKGAVCHVLLELGLDPRDPATRFWSKTSPGDGGCIEMDSYGHDGYKYFSVDGANMLAHRYAYEMKNGEIEAEMTVDHLCNNRGCVNVEHMEIVTQSENSKRMIERRKAAGLPILPDYSPFRKNKP